MKFEHSAGIVLYTLNNSIIEYLILHYESGHWDLPKGKLETRETEQEAALRELQEETGITQVSLDPEFQTQIHYLYKNPQGELVRKKVTFFLGLTHTKTITLSYEHIGYEWLTYQEALARLTYKNAQELLKKAHAHVIE